jgi:transposase
MSRATTIKKEQVVKEYSRFIGLDTHKESITVAYAESGRQEPLDYGDIPNTPDALSKMVKKLAHGGAVRFCYEAGPCGYGLYRQLRSLGHDCIVVAPSLIPRKSGCRVKTNRRDARSLARLDRSGELTAVWVPDESQEAIRDLVRCRKDFKEQQRMVRQRLGAFLLRHGRIFDGKAWTRKHALWMEQQRFEHPAQEIVFREYLHQLDYAGERLLELGRQMEKSLEGWSLRPVVDALMALRGVAMVTAMTTIAELGDISRFDSPGQLMAFLGLVPSEYSTGDKRCLGHITKTGNGHVRKVLIESSWCYRQPARMTAHLKAKASRAPQIARDIAWKAQKRLHDRYWHLVAKGKLPVQAVTAVARELAGFVWAIASAAMGKTVFVRADEAKNGNTKGNKKDNDNNRNSNRNGNDSDNGTNSNGDFSGHKGPTPIAEAAPEHPPAHRPPAGARSFASSLPHASRDDKASNDGGMDKKQKQQ